MAGLDRAGFVVVAEWGVGRMVGRWVVGKGHNSGEEVVVAVGDDYCDDCGD